MDTGNYEYKNNIDLENAQKIIEKIFLITPTTHASNINYKLENKSKKYWWVNAIILRKNPSGKCRIIIAFSFARFEHPTNKNNYFLCVKQKTIEEINKKILALFRLLTFKAVEMEDLEITSIDFSNQLEVDSIRKNSSVYSLIFTTLKQKEEDGRLYIDVDNSTKFNKENEKRRKTIRGLDFKETGKQRRQSQVYLKLYSKMDEMHQKGKNTKGLKQAIRFEATFRGAVLKKYGIFSPSDLTKEKMRNCLHDFFLTVFTVELEKELNNYLNILKKEVMATGTKGIKEKLLRHQHLIFDVEMLDMVITPNTTTVSTRQCRTYIKQIKEALEEYEKDFEFERSYAGNFKRLKALIKKGAYINLEITAEEGEIKVNEINK